MGLRSGLRRAGHPAEGTSSRPADGPAPAPPGTAAAAPRRTGWLVPDGEGRLSAYAAGRGGGIVRWTESATRPYAWTPPELLLADGRILPYLSVARGPRGYIDLFAMRRKGGGPESPVEIVYASQYQAGRPLTGWHSIGNPQGRDAAPAASIGAPVAVVDGSGKVHVFVRSATGGVFTRRRSQHGTWSKWTALPCEGVREGLSPVVTGSGRVELLMPADDGVYVWRQAKPGVPLERAPDLAYTARPESVSGIGSYEDRVTHFWRDDATGEVVAHRLTESGGEDTAPDGLAALDGRSGRGPVALSRCDVDGHDCTVLAQADGSGTLAVSAYPTELESAGAWWTDTREPCEGAPALARDRAGRLVVAAIGREGGLSVTRQRTDQQGMALKAWSRV
ncbi:hypothetical protein [Streptomyces sp. NPDC048565]|uniref:hypothetical protein n=1 Tax=Streptomyces sp. NPDC048565 TaxID=3155266 RepID=UPI0034224F3A